MACRHRRPLASWRWRGSYSLDIFEHYRVDLFVDRAGAAMSPAMVSGIR
jgi:hypothetical protein